MTPQKSSDPFFRSTPAQTEVDERLPKPGEIVGGCRITGIIGTGSMSVVYRAFEIDLEVERAVKVLLPDVSPSVRRKFDAEGKISARLDHPNIVKVHGSGIWKGLLPFIKMEYIEGKSLRRFLQVHGSVHPAFSLAVVAVCCKALEFARQQNYSIWGNTSRGIVHRDMKPENILINRRGVLKVADFGVAQTEDEHEPVPMGTVLYMSPEQHDDDGPVEASSDIFSLGLILYEMIAGTHPFEGSDFPELISRKCSGAYAPIQRHAPSIGREVRTIIARCLQPDAGKRYAVYADLQHACEEQLGTMTGLPAEAVIEVFTRNPESFKEVLDEHKPGRRRTRGKIMATAIISATAVGLVLALALLKMPEWPGEQRHGTDGIEKKQPPAPRAPRKIRPAGAGGKKRTRPAAPPSAHRPVRPKTTARPPARTSSPAKETTRTKNKSASTPFATAGTAFRRKDFPRAVELLEPLLYGIEIDKTRKDSIATMVLESYYMLSDFKSAVLLARNSPARDARFLMILGLVYEALDDNGSAESCFKKATTAPTAWGEAAHAEAVLQRAEFHRRRYRALGTDTARRSLIRAWRDVEREFCGRDPGVCTEARNLIGQYLH